MENLNNIKALTDSPMFNADKWNTSVEQIETVMNLLTKINNRFRGIYDYKNNYKLGETVFIEDNLYELSNDSSEHFSEVKEENIKSKDIKLYYLNNNKLTDRNNNKISDEDFDFIVNNHYTNEILCIKGKTGYVFDKISKTLNSLNVYVNSDIKSACLDKFAFYLGLDRKIIQKSKKIDDISHKEIFTSDFIIKDITCNSDYIFALLSDNTINVINKKDKSVLRKYNTNINFSEKVKIKITSSNNFFIFDKNILYTYRFSNGDFININKIKYTPNKEVKALECFTPYLYFIGNDNNFICSKDTLHPLLKTELRYILSKNNMIIEDLYSYINPKNNIFDSLNMILKNKEIANIIKNKGLEINSNRLVYKINDEIINKTLYLKIDSNIHNEAITLKVSKNKLINLTINETGSKEVFIDIHNDEVKICIYKNKNLIKEEKINLLPALNSENTLEFISNSSDTYIIESIIIFNYILSNVKKNTVIDNVLFLPNIENKTNFLPYSIVTNDISGSPILKLSGKSLLIDNSGLKVNLVQEIKDELKEEDREKILSLYGLKKFKNDFELSFSKKLTDELNKEKKINWDLLENVPEATTSKKGLVLLNTDINDESSIKAATPKMVKEVERLTENKIENLKRTKIKNIENEIYNIKNTTLTKLYDDINSFNNKTIREINKLGSSIDAPNSYLNKEVGGIVKGDLTVRNINLSNNVISLNKNIGEVASIRFGEGYITHSSQGSGIDSFKISASDSPNDSSGGIDFGYTQNNTFNRTSFISSSGVGSFKIVTTGSDINVGRDIKLSGDLFLTSDRRIKREIKKVNNALEKILKLNGYTFYKKGFENKTAGIIAQEVRDVFPELVNEKNSILEVNYNGLHSLIIEAIKEINSKIDNLENEIRNLKG
ncbi:tail fiber domain-containing protein [Fusobacterium polymorphum]|uniref:tail fiber domain-containing protein n=1 Tax=Fusobacterium nucleatum subsp. polymorphum TaxID=76857 RepID=UPI0030D1AB3A